MYFSIGMALVRRTYLAISGGRKPVRFIGLLNETAQTR
jgi:hypothetical protein